MPTYRSIACVAVACWLVSIASAFAARNALIVIGTTGDPTISSDLLHVAQTIQGGLVQRGFAPDAIEILGAPTAGEKITGDQVLASLKKRQTLAATDEFWLVLLGFSGRSAEGAMAFQVTGPRLTVAELKPALDAIPARQFVFVGTSDSGGYVAALLQANRNVLSATKEEGEIDLPRFPEAWAAALKENPQAGWKEIAARAAAIIKQTYVTDNLAQGEHARLGDPETGQVLEPPFGVDTVAQPAQAPASDGSMALVNASDIKVEIRKPNAEWEKQAATPETKKLIETARATPNPEGFNSIMLEQRLGYKVGEDRSAEDFVMQRIYIAKEDGVARWANFLLAQDPPAVTTKLEAARIIQPDGSSTVFNPAKMPVATDCTSGLCGALTMVFMPDVHAGCLIEIAYRTRHLLDASMPDFSEELPVQLDIPVLKTELQLQIPPTNQVHYKLRNSDQKPVETLVDGMRTLTWKLDNLTAFEPLPYDPPERDIAVTLDISSLDSWDAFATWTRRLLRGSDEQDDTVKEKAAELADGAATRLAKIRKAYEFVSALRYVAIEFGVNGIRPRSPTVVLQNRYGDCKDKANLLIALLGDMGIDAHLSVLNRGSSTDITFPSWQFNHAIAYVPKAPETGQPDDLWLDTTDSTAPFPTLSPGDIGRNALVFGKDSAKFLTVTALGKDVTTVKEDWNLTDKEGGTWTGTLQDTWSGLAEYDVRSSVRGRTPRQRDFILQTALARQLPDADFTGINLTPADDLSIPLKMEARVAAPSKPSPLPAFHVNDYFAPPERNRPLLINNGQKLHLIQTVNLTYAQAGDASRADPAPFDQQVAGIHATITWKGSARNGVLSRTAELTIDQPEVAQADYAAVRQMLRNWNNQLGY
ncbi:MAG: DUF3857 domain-containing transglutaminase family protein [Methylacidiphilales bacterium]|nr:DUF3857 domain-containing transglutaminase family protein [Candidatus Methylacidiphilales bacterium]